MKNPFKLNALKFASVLRAIIVVAVVVVALAGSAAAAVIVVNPAGGGNYTTIQAAINNAKPGDTIAVKTGTYSENLNLSLMGSAIGGGTGNLQIVATDGAGTAVLSGSGVKISQTGAFNGSLIVDGFRLSTTNEDGIRLSTLTNLLLVNNTFDPIGSDNTSHNGLELSLSSGTHQIALSNNVFRNIANDAVVLSATGAGTQVTYTIVGNTVTDNGTNANTTDQGITITSAGSAVVNATVADNSLTQLESRAVVLSAGDTSQLRGYVARNTISQITTVDNAVTIETLNSATTASVDATIADNNINNVSSGNGIFVQMGGATAQPVTPSITARIVRNTLTAIGNNDFDRGISIAPGVSAPNLGGTITALVADNQLTNIAASGLYITQTGSSINIDATVRNNTITNAVTFPSANEAGILLRTNSATGRLRASMTNNVTTTATPATNFEIRLLNQVGTLQIEGNAALTPEQNVAADNPTAAGSILIGGTIGIIARGTVTVPTENTIPVAADDAASTTSIASASINVLANDTDAQGAVDINFFSFSSMRGGTVTRNVSDGTLVYTPPIGFSGTDTFYYTIVDGGLASDIAKVTVTVTFAPTAAPVSISGRVLTSANRGLTNAMVYLTDAEGNTLAARTTAFGYYRFEGVAPGQTVIISVRSKRYEFAPQVWTVTENITDLNFVGNY